MTVVNMGTMKCCYDCEKYGNNEMIIRLWPLLQFNGAMTLGNMATMKW